MSTAASADDDAFPARLRGSSKGLSKAEMTELALAVIAKHKRDEEMLVRAIEQEHARNQSILQQKIRRRQDRVREQLK